MKHSTVKTIVFDLGGVVFTDGTSKVIREISCKYNISTAEIINLFNGDIGSAYRKGNLTLLEFWNVVKNKLGISEHPDVLSEIWHNGYKPISGTIQILEQLRSQHFELLYLSDNVKERVDYLESKYHFMNFFRDGIFSFSVGIRKPDIQIYKLLLKKTNSLPEECLYIDDVEKFLYPARKLNMQTIFFVNPEQLAYELAECRIKTNY